MKNLLFFLLLPVFCHGQGDQTIIKVPIDAQGDTYQAILHLPDDYASTGTAYPLLMFFHGIGEGGPNPASIYNSSTAGGPAYFIAQGSFPSSFVNPKDKKPYKFIVVSPQMYPGNDQGSTTAQQADYILTYLCTHYRVDTTRIYLTGLSDGGQTTVEYLGGTMSQNLQRFQRTHHVAAILPMSENGIAMLMQQQADTITSENIGAWGFGSSDEQGQNTLALAWDCNVIKTGSMITTSYSGGHCCWGQFYNPSFTQNGMSLYEWMLQYQTAVKTTPVTATAPTVPIANAGASPSIRLPTTQVSLDGSASSVTNGTIAKYQWRQLSGPAKAVISNPNTASPTVTGLTESASYNFSLTITDNTGKTNTAGTQIIVQPPVGQGLIPGTIQAFTYRSAIGVMQQKTTDGSGLNIGWIDKGDWMDYTVTVATAGQYTAAFRVAALNPGAAFQVRNASGAVLATVNVPCTKGYQVWTTTSVNLTLPAGSQTLQVYSLNPTNWNFHWMQFSSDPSTSDAALDTFTPDTASAGVVVYPNPVRTGFTLSVTNAHTGNMSVQVIDLYGDVHQSLVVRKDLPAQQVHLDMSTLPAGFYAIRVSIGSWRTVKKLLKE